MVRVLFFGKLGDLAGGREREIALSDSASSVSGLIAAINTEDTVLAAALEEPSVRVIVNENMADRGTQISDRDEVAFIPPVSGG